MRTNAYLRIAIALCMVAGTLAFSGCAKPVSQEETLLIWPAYPEEPRVAFVRSYMGKKDYQKHSFLDTIFGAPLMASDLRQPYGVAAHKGKIYVADTGQSAVIVIDPALQEVKRIGVVGPGRLSRPQGIAVGKDGTVYVSDSSLKRVIVFDAKGELYYEIGKKGEFAAPSGIALDEERNRLLVADSYKHVVRVMSLKGEMQFTLGGRGEENGMFNYPSFVAVNRKNGQIYVSDTQNFRVQVFTADGKFLRKFGEIGDRPGTFSRPKGIGIDSEDHVYVIDAAFENFQIFDDTGQVLMFVGSLGTKWGSFQVPAGLYVDENDMIYVVDTYNQRIQTFQYISEQWKKAHPEEYAKYRQDPATRKKPAP